MRLQGDATGTKMTMGMLKHNLRGINRTLADCERGMS